MKDFITLKPLYVFCFFLAHFSIISQSQYAEDKLVVVFDPNMPQQDIDDLLIELNMEITEGPTPITNAYLLSLINGEFPDWAYSDPISPINGVKEKAQTTSGTDGVGFDYEIDNPSGIYHEPGGIDDCFTSQFQKAGIYPKKFGILDTGLGRVNSLEQYLEYPNSGYNFVDDTSDFTDNNDHGTHVASIALKDFHSTAVDLHVCKTHDMVGIGSSYDVIDAIDYAILEDVNILNMSFSFQERYSYRNDNTAPMAIAIQNALEIGGILCIASAGNVGLSNDDVGSFSSYPASFLNDNIISVGAADCSNDRTVWSNFGETSVDVLAMGVMVPGVDKLGNHLSLSGTSQAAAGVSNLAILLGSELPTFDYQFVKCAIINGVTQSPGNSTLSRGVVNYDRSLEIIRSGLCSQINTLGIHEYQEPKDISINAAQLVEINSDVEGPHTIQVFNTIGQRIFERKEYIYEGQNIIDLSNLKINYPGYYSLVLRSKNSIKTISFLR